MTSQTKIKVKIYHSSISSLPPLFISVSSTHCTIGLELSIFVMENLN